TSMLAITFDPPPAHLIRPDMSMQSLSTIDQRVTKIKQMGADVVKVITPTLEWLEQTPDAFIKTLWPPITSVAWWKAMIFALGKIGKGTFPC
ncbi:MAG: hypothetical protein JKX85_15820, partial [Phycisphaeraceae bacterium]|nr:hypothetical protein [Phycisphaeraceae bacterium]